MFLMILNVWNKDELIKIFTESTPLEFSGKDWIFVAEP